MPGLVVELASYRTSHDGADGESRKLHRTAPD
jgi:hypothetical protein